MLLAAKPDVLQADKHGASALHRAGGPLLKWLLGLIANFCGSLDSFFLVGSLQVSRGHLQVVTELLAHGASANQKDNQRNTPLYPLINKEEEGGEGGKEAKNKNGSISCEHRI